MQYKNTNKRRKMAVEVFVISAAIVFALASNINGHNIVGFTLHNTTEGLAIVAPMPKSNKVMVRRLVMMGMIAGAPAIAGAWIGGFLYSPIAAIIFLSVGAGAIFQVVFSIMSWMITDSNNNNNNNIDDSKNKEGRKNSWLNTSLVAGFIVGMIIMYVTSLLVSS